MDGLSRFRNKTVFDFFAGKKLSLFLITFIAITLLPLSVSANGPTPTPTPTPSPTPTPGGGTPAKDTTPPTITKTMFGGYYGDCPPGENGDECYVAGNGTSGVEIFVEDLGEYAVGLEECYYELWWEEEEEEPVDEGYFTEYAEIIFEEESEHGLYIYCEDALGNDAEDEETFIVDSTPPYLYKEVDEPSILGVGPYYAMSGNYLWGTDLDGTEEDVEEPFDSMHTALQTPSIDLTGFSSASLHFWSYNDSENNDDDYDYEYVEISTDSGENWSVISSQESDDWPWTIEYDRTWRHLSYDISAYAGSTILIRFRYDTDGDCCGEPGWYIDDVSVFGNGSEVFSDDMESGGEGWSHYAVDEGADTWEWGYPTGYSYITQETSIEFECEDQEPHPSGAHEIWFRIWVWQDDDEDGERDDDEWYIKLWDNSSEDWVIDEGELSVGPQTPTEEGWILYWNYESEEGTEEFTIPQNCLHVLEYYCIDYVGNMSESQYQVYFIDSQPPITEKDFNGPHKIDGDVEWIDGVTEIVLDARDEGHAGLDKTWYLNVIDLTEQACWDPSQYCQPVSNFIPSPYEKGGECIDYFQEVCDEIWQGYWDSWEECVEYFAYDECGVDPLWELYDGTPIEKGEESCHLFQYFSVDKIGNVEEMNVNCFFVDTTAPGVEKEVGDPSEDDFDEFLDEDFYWVSPETEIEFVCKDEGPHPAGDEELCFKVSYDLDPDEYNTDEYCAKYSGSLEGEWCCVDATPQNPFIFNFNENEDSLHDLEYYCRDAVGKKSEIEEIQYYKVDGTPPSITKTMFGEYYGDCPPTEPGDICYASGNEESSVEIYVEDVGECAVGIDECYYELCWDGSEGWECDDDDFEDDVEIVFEEDSEHELYIKCWDYLENYVEDVEVFYVDSSPPITTKEYGEPHKTCLECRAYYEEECLEDCDGMPCWEDEGYSDLDECVNDYAHSNCPQRINAKTPITLNAKDEKVGVAETYWRNFFIEDTEICEYPEEFCNPRGYGEWIDEETPQELYAGPFYKTQEGCHVIEYYSVDLVGNEEEMKWQCVFVEEGETMVWSETADVIDSSYNDENNYYNYLINDPSGKTQSVKVFLNGEWVTLSDLNVDGNMDFKIMPDENIIVSIQDANITGASWNESKKELNIEADGSGTQEVVIYVNGNGKPNSIKVDGKTITNWTYDAATQTVTFTMEFGSIHGFLLSWYTPPAPTTTPAPETGPTGGARRAYYCGDEKCYRDETYCDCPQDCEAPECGTCEETNCETGEPVCVAVTPCVGNGVCEEGENCANAPEDCPCEEHEECVGEECITLLQCGDGICQENEDCRSCREDCVCPSGQVCINATCITIPFCGDGTCNANESFETCPEDCEAPTEEIPEAEGEAEEAPPAPAAPAGFFGLGTLGDIVAGLLIVIIIGGTAFYFKARKH